MKDRLNKGNWTIALSGSGTATANLGPGGVDILSLTDDSVNNNPTATPAGDRYNIVSGALGVNITGQEASVKTYGHYYSDMGVLVFSATELSASIPGSGSQAGSTVQFSPTGRVSTNIGDQFRGFGFPTNASDTVDRKVALRFVNCLKPLGGKLSFRDEEDQVSAQYFCRVRSGQSNFSNNPTFVSGSNNELRNSKMRGNPQTFISSVQLFGEIDNSAGIVERNVVNYTQTLSEASIGIQTKKVVSGSISQSHWNSLNVLFYTSGSPSYTNEHKFAKPSNNLSLNPTRGTQFLTKYHGYPSSSIITIPSQYYGEKIKENSFKLTDSDNTDNDGNKPIIIDDGFGNLYSTNAHHSQSTSADSSSDNYVGNIFYDKGLVVLTETGSWSGSVKYSDLVDNYNLEFNSHNTITTYEYNLVLRPNEYNNSTNYSLRAPLSGSNPSYTVLSTQYLATDYTSSNFQPYITTINLYQAGNYNEPVIQATLPRPIRKSDKINLAFKIRLDI